jgi:hypothetical protein
LRESNILAKFIETALIFRRDIQFVIIIQIRKGRPQYIVPAFLFGFQVIGNSTNSAATRAATCHYENRYDNYN